MPVSELDRKYFDGNPEMQQKLQEAQTALEMGRLAYDLRNEASLSEIEMAEKLGVSPDVISDFELGDCEDNAQEFLVQIAKAVGK